MLAIATATLVVLVFAIIVPMYRRVRLRDEPMRLWGRRWESTAEAAEALAGAMGLASARRPKRWWVTLLMAPVWLLWDPMGTDVDSMQRLAPWLLTGARASGRSVRVEFPAERVRFALGCESRAFFSAKAKRGGVRWPLEEQEGLRLLHPIGGLRWQEGTQLIEAAFAQSLDSLTLRGGTLVADMALDDRGPLPEEYPRVLEALDRLALCLEHVGSDGTARSGPAREPADALAPAL